MELDAIEARWREIVNSIEDLIFDITEHLKKDKTLALVFVSSSLLFLASLSYQS